LIKDHQDLVVGGQIIDAISVGMESVTKADLCWRRRLTV
jgi:hypothetical protein